MTKPFLFNYCIIELMISYHNAMNEWYVGNIKIVNCDKTTLFLHYVDGNAHKSPGYIEHLS